MKIRVKANPDSPRERARRLLRTIARAEDAAPIEAMDELIRLAQADEEISAAVIDATESVLAADPASLSPCWLVLVVGELPIEDQPWALLFGLTASEGDALDEALIPVLTRRAVALFEPIVDAIVGADVKDVHYRHGLYDVLEGVVLAGDEAQKARLAELALGWVEQEKAHRLEFCAVDAPLFLLAALRHPEVHRLIEESRALCQRGDFLDRELNDVAAMAAGEDLLTSVREIMATDWRDTARHIEGLFRSVVDQ